MQVDCLLKSHVFTGYRSDTNVLFVWFSLKDRAVLSTGVTVLIPDIGCFHVVLTGVDSSTPRIQIRWVLFFEG